MYDLLQSFTGLNFAEYDPVLVFLFVALVTVLVFDVCYGLLRQFFHFLFGIRG